MKILYERDLNRTWVILEEDGEYAEDYQMKMLRANTFHYLLPVFWQGRDETNRFRYEITGKTSLQNYFARKKITSGELRQFVEQLIEAVKEARKYLLEPDKLLIDPELIFWEKGQFWFCYYPFQKENIWEKFHHLTEYFVRETDYTDREVVYLVSELHKASMEENYSIEKIMETLSEPPEDKEEKECYHVEPDYWVDETGNSPSAAESVQEQWEGWKTPEWPFHRKKKKRWGNWEGLEL